MDARQANDFDFGFSNDEQKEAIITTEGPVLVLAGPGTGKTQTLVKRIAYLLLEKAVRPGELFVATFTDKAAKEILTRLSNELPAEFVFNPEEMYIGTFHSLCLRMIREHADASELPKSFKTVDSTTLDYLLLTHLEDFWNLRGSSGKKPFPHFLEMFNGMPDKNHPYERNMFAVTKIKKAVSTITDYGVTTKMLFDTGNRDAIALGAVNKAYQELLAQNGLLDFAKMQQECLRILKERPDVLAELQSRLSYFLIDEYQDTDRVQEEILFLLARKSGNLFVVGDDDQGLYRFRGATVRNILDFEERIARNLGNTSCKVIRLEKNYRSDPQIIDFYNSWMREIRVPGHDFGWEVGSRKYRAPKTIIPGSSREEAGAQASPGANAVYKLVGRGATWRKSIIDMIQALKTSGVISNHNQVAFLTFSTTSAHCLELQRDMEAAGIGVYSPRSSKFFDQKIVRQLLGMLLQLFKSSADYMFDTAYRDDRRDAVKEDYAEYVKYARKSMEIIEDFMDENDELKSFITAAQKRNAYKFDKADYSFTDMMYQAFAFEPFKSVLATDMRSGIKNQRDIRNASDFMQLVSKFETLVGVDRICDLPKPGAAACELVGKYFHHLFQSGVNEYEDAVEYAPEDCVSFLTIHQSKGLEFPVTIVDVTGASFPEKPFLSTLEQLVREAGGEKNSSIGSQASAHDFWRRYYTAFSRAQDLLVVTRDSRVEAFNSRWVDTAFDPYLNDGEPDSLSAFNAEEFASSHASSRFAEMGTSYLKPVFSFTTHFGLYESCPRKYKFYRELKFPTKKAVGMFFGTVVHQTIEDVNNAMMAGKGESYVNEKLEGWLNINCAALELSEKTTIDASMRKHALEQVKRYMTHYAGRWNDLVAAELPISLARKKYIARGSIDLVKKSNDDDSLVLVDFKTGKKPDVETNGDDASLAENLLGRYREQLNMYASLITSQKDENGNARTVSYTQLYYVGASSKPTITFDCSKEGIERARENFDDIASRIIDKDFSTEASNEHVCKTCDFRFYCGKSQPQR